MKALIFGAGGQTAHYLAEICRENGLDTVSASRSGGQIRADVGDREQVDAIVRLHSPAFVFHLAAASTTRHEALFENHRTISTGTLNVLESVRLHAPRAKVFLTGSGVQFVNRGEPISETDAFEPSSPYAVSRQDSVQAGRYFRSLGLRVYVGYLFHHESPLRSAGHVSQMIASAVRCIAAGSRERLLVGDPAVEKEWTFAGDVARAIFLLVMQELVSEAAIGSGKAYSIEAWIEACFALAGLDWRAHVDVRPDFVAEYRRLVSNPSTIRSLGWEPRVSFGDLAQMMVRGIA